MQFPPKGITFAPSNKKDLTMLLRLITLLLLLVSTSCHDVRQDVETWCGDVDGYGLLQDDDSDSNYVYDCNCFGIVSSNDAPAVRTVSRHRTTQRIVEKRRMLSESMARFACDNVALKFFAGERHLYCCLEKSGRSLLHFLCKLSI